MLSVPKVLSKVPQKEGHFRIARDWGTQNEQRVYQFSSQVATNDFFRWAVISMVV
jgi:hypothetical protein